MKTNLATILALLVTIGGLGGAARAQTQEDDHATVHSGHDPEAEARGPMRIAEPDAVTVGESLGKTFGLGFGSTPGGVTGVEVEYYLGDLMLNGHLGLVFFAPEVGDSTTAFALAAGAFYRFRAYGDLAVMLGGRLDIGYANAGYVIPSKLPQEPGAGSATQFNVEAMLRAEYYFAGVMSVHAEVGPVLAIIGEGGGVLGESWQSASQGLYFDLPLFHLLAGFGVTIYLE